jgi:hypothetical protein
MRLEMGKELLQGQIRRGTEPLPVLNMNLVAEGRIELPTLGL